MKEKIATEPKVKKERAKGSYIIHCGEDHIYQGDSLKDCIKWIKKEGLSGKTYTIIKHLKTITIKEITRKVLV